MTQEVKNTIIKHYSKIITDYLLVKKKKHPYFKTCKESPPIPERRTRREEDFMLY